MIDRFIGVDAIIFDMDGVLVDVSRSYRKAIALTVNYIPNRQKRPSRIGSSQIAALKRIPGFNNDWDAAYELVELANRNVSLDAYRQFATPIPKQVRKSRRYQAIKKIFQAYYLGNVLFKRIYGQKPPLSIPQGLIDQESLLVRKNILSTLGQTYSLGVATGRPRFEALYTLKMLGIVPVFMKESCVVALEDAKREKPAPDSLVIAQNRLGSKYPIYVGDTINDTLAAQNAGMRSIFVGKASMGTYQIESINKILDLLKNIAHIV